MPRERGAGERTPGHLPFLDLCTHDGANGNNGPKAVLYNSVGISSIAV